jgi:putative effector of murein hydrolase
MAKPLAKLFRSKWSSVSVVTVAAISTAIWLLLKATAPAEFDHDPMDSPLLDWIWLILPVAALLAGAVGGIPWLVALAVVIPLVVGVVLEGTVFYESSEGASFWLVSAFGFVLVGAISGLAANLGMRFRRRSQHGSDE